MGTFGCWLCALVTAGGVLTCIANGYKLFARHQHGGYEAEGISCVFRLKGSLDVCPWSPSFSVCHSQLLKNPKFEHLVTAVVYRLLYGWSSKTVAVQMYAKMYSLCLNCRLFGWWAISFTHPVSSCIINTYTLPMVYLLFWHVTWNKTTFFLMNSLCFTEHAHKDL